MRTYVFSTYMELKQLNGWKGEAEVRTYVPYVITFCLSTAHHCHLSSLTNKIVYDWIVFPVIMIFHSSSPLLFYPYLISSLFTLFYLSSSPHLFLSSLHLPFSLFP